MRARFIAIWPGPNSKFTDRMTLCLRLSIAILFSSMAGVACFSLQELLWNTEYDAELTDELISTAAEVRMWRGEPHYLLHVRHYAGIVPEP